MPLMNHTAFPDKVASGEKRQSIRKRRKAGEFEYNKPIYHYAGLRTRNCRKILEAVCSSVKPIVILANGIVKVDGRRLTRAEVALLASRDGFDSVRAFFDYFTLGQRKRLRKNFLGNLIEWHPLKEHWLQ